MEPSIFLGKTPLDSVESAYALDCQVHDSGNDSVMHAVGMQGLLHSV